MTRFFSFLFFVLIVSAANAQVVDFGVKGELFDIKEKNGNVLIKEKLSKLDYKKLEKELAKEVESMKTSHLPIKTSMADFDETAIDVYRTNRDIKNYDGTMMYRKGDVIPTMIPHGIKKEMCFVDGKLSKEITTAIIQEFGKNCIYFVNNMNVELFSEIYNIDAYPMGGQNKIFLSRYGVKELPTKIVRFSDKIERVQLNVKRLSLENGENHE